MKRRNSVSFAQHEHHQSRRSVYLSTNLHDRIETTAKRWGRPKARVLEAFIHLALDREGAP